MENKGCDTCKYEHRDIQDYPCSKCSHSYIDKYEPKTNVDRIRNKYEPKTNADRIRNMSDEELAKKLCLLLDCRRCRTFKTWNAGSMCYANLLEWLKSEAE